jgi:hypothetical protein
MLSLVRAALPMVERRLESGTLVHSAHVHEESLGEPEKDDAIQFHDGVSTRGDDGPTTSNTNQVWHGHEVREQSFPPTP